MTYISVNGIKECIYLLLRHAEIIFLAKVVPQLFLGDETLPISINTAEVFANLVLLLVLGGHGCLSDEAEGQLLMNCPDGSGCCAYALLCMHNRLDADDSTRKSGALLHNEWSSGLRRLSRDSMP